jgi:multicomponent Na+:H+ antiporter subunit B
MMTEPKKDILVRAIARVFTPFIQIYALYVIMHGHHSPGGGFQGGVILAACLVLMLITRGLADTRKQLSEKMTSLLSSAGVMIYVGIGALCLALSGNFLDYHQLAPLLNVSPAQARSLGILGVEIGVGIAVMAVMYSIFYNIATAGKDMTPYQKSIHDDGM